jgi:acylpyruvate hydrolase
MRLVTFSVAGDARLGALIGDRDGDAVVDLGGVYAAWQRTATPGDAASRAAAQMGIFPFTMMSFLQAGPLAREVATQALDFAAVPENLAALRRLGLAFAAGQVTYLPPILRPGKVICLGQNYRQHVTEMKHEMPQYPVLFAKFASSLTGHRQPIVLPGVSQRVDYEGELAIVIGRRGKDILPKEAFDHIFGFTCFNDVSVRDFQRRTTQWLQGKTFDTSGPVGPAIVSLDEISNPAALELTTRLNGQVMQQGNTSDFIFDIPTIIAYISQIATLEAGDIISTGTPSGVGDARNPQVYLKPGDVVRVEIAGVGTLENPVVAPQADPRWHPEQAKRAAAVAEQIQPPGELGLTEDSKHIRAEEAREAGERP